MAVSIITISNHGSTSKRLHTQEYFHPVAAPASSFVSSRTRSKVPQDTTDADTERGHAGFYRREEQRQQEDDVEEEDALVPTLHVGARSPYTVGG